MKTPPAFSIRPLARGDAPSLSAFLRDIARAGEDAFFHPHPADPSSLRRLCSTPTRDVYLLARWGNRVIGYGLLRGWDEGYEIPSLGIAVHPQFRGMRVGLTLMHVLHAVARLRGAARVRLKVYPENRRALSMYRRLGYRFRGVEKGQRVGFLDLD